MTEPSVNVAIQTEDEITFELYGDFYSPQFQKDFSGKFIAKIEDGKIAVKNEEEILRANGSAITFEPNLFEAESFFLRGVTIGIKFHWERKENQRFLGSLKLLKENDKITAVNILPVEHYLTSVISSEMNSNSSLELLKAHAIISRGWLLAQIEKGRELSSGSAEYQSRIENENELIKWYDREDHTLYDVCADDHCQRYQGITKVYSDSARKAIEETRGLILTYNGKICDTRFSKSCGGITEAFQNVWENVEHPYLTKVIDYRFEPDNYDLDLTQEKAADTWIRSNPPAFCNTTDQKILSQVLLDYDQQTKDFFRWTKEYSQREISELIKNKSGIDFGDILDLIPVERGFSGRLIKLKIVGSKKTLIIGKELEIRRILSTSHLYSSEFVIDKEDISDGVPQRFILTGAGWGHGVGLCQIGAAVMGAKGYLFDEILLHYFKGAKIEKVY